MVKRLIFLAEPRYTGIGKYVEDIVNYVSMDTQIFSILFKRKINQEYLGIVNDGDLKLPFTNGWYFNSHFQSIAFKRLRMDTVSKPAGKIFHYADIQVTPFTDPTQSVVTVHDLFNALDKYNRKYGYKIYSFVKKNIKKYRHFSNVITDSKYVANEATENGFEGNPVVIYPPVSKEFKQIRNKRELREKWNLPLNKTLIFSISSNDPRKNVKTVVETVKELGPNFSLVRIGSPVNSAYNFMKLKSNEVNELYNACDMLLFPTLDEGFGYPLVEAMATGLPIVSSNIPVIEEVTANAAELVEPSIKNLKQAIYNVIADPSAFIEKGLKRAMDFSFERFSNQLTEYYDSMLE